METPYRIVAEVPPQRVDLLSDTTRRILPLVRNLNKGEALLLRTSAHGDKVAVRRLRDSAISVKRILERGSIRRYRVMERRGDVYVQRVDDAILWRSSESVEAGGVS